MNATEYSATGYNAGVIKFSQLAVLLACFTLCGCPKGETHRAQTSAGAGSSEDAALAEALDEAAAAEHQSDDAPAPDAEPPKQLILIYTGHTLSRPDMVLGFSPPEGGLSALTAAILNYEAQIAEYNRLRVLNQGGDADSVRTDFARGTLGDHPFMLLDYGGWSRPNDFLGDTYVALYFRMFVALNYTAVACQLLDRLPPERWEAYLPQLPEGFRLVASAGRPQSAGVPVTELVTRQVHGGLWGIAAVPLPAKDSDPESTLKQYVEQAAAKLDNEACDYRILLLADGPARLYDELAADQRFSVVIGAPQSKGVPEGYGEVPSQGALLLPQLKANGREIGVCHLYYTAVGDKPVQYNFSRKACIEDPQSPFPFRTQVAEAVEEHQARYEEWAASQQPVDE